MLSRMPIPAIAVAVADPCGRAVRLRRGPRQRGHRQPHRDDARQQRVGHQVDPALRDTERQHAGQAEQRHEQRRQRPLLGGRLGGRGGLAPAPARVDGGHSSPIVPGGAR